MVAGFFREEDEHFILTTDEQKPNYF